MCNIINQSGFWIILGTIIGFTLSELSNIIKNKVKNSNLKNLLMDEIDSNYYQINYKIKIIDNIIVVLQDKKFLSGKSVSFSSTAFTHHFASIIGAFTPIQRDNIRNVYNLLSKIDEILNDFDVNYLDDIDHLEIRKNSLSGINKKHIAILNNLKDSLSMAQNLISKLKEGEPIDIYNRNNK